MTEKVEKTEQERIQDFLKDYEALCKKHGIQLVPQLKQSFDTGTWDIVQGVAKVA